MNDITAIEQRISRRRYLAQPIAPDLRAALDEKLTQINSESGLTCLFLEDGAAAFVGGKSYGMFNGVKAMLVLKGPKTLEHLIEKVGYYGEQLMLLATSLGLGTCWVGGTFDAKSLHCDDNEQMVCVIPVGYVTEKGSLKENFLRGMARRKTKTVAEMIESDGPLDARTQAAMELVQRAPSARNSQKVKFRFQAGEVRAQVPEDYFLDLVDLGIAKLHFVCGMGGSFAFGNGAAWTESGSGSD